MKGAIASVEIFSARDEGPPRRMTLTVTAPTRSSGEGVPDGNEWECRVALADLHRPTTVVGGDSVAVLTAALDLARDWLAELRDQGFTLYRDPACHSRFETL